MKFSEVKELKSIPNGRGEYKQRLHKSNMSVRSLDEDVSIGVPVAEGSE